MLFNGSVSHNVDRGPENISNLKYMGGMAKKAVQPVVAGAAAVTL